MNKIPVIAIFDVGKTNKKVFLFNRQYKIVFEKQVFTSEIMDEDGDACEDLEQLILWIEKAILTIFQQSSYEIKAINFCAYGASLVHLDEQNRPLTQLYNYLKDFPEEISKEFYQKYGGSADFSMQTASPLLGSLNSGLQLYRLKKQQPTVFSRIKYSLHLPQFLAWLVNQKYYSEMTSIGCHTALWNFIHNNYHEWVYREIVFDKLAPVVSSEHADSILLEGQQILAGVGLHDSSAALIPYLRSFSDPFILISTGSWCINLNPFNDKPLSNAELQADCLCYLSYRGKPVKASRIFAGYQHEQEIKRISNHFNKQEDYYAGVSFVHETVNLLRKKNNQPVPQRIPGFSLFHSRNLSDFESFEQAYHQLIMDIISDQVHSLNLILDGVEIKKIFVDGGFSKNHLYMQMLADSFRGIDILAATVPQASAMGAALAIHDAWNSAALPADLLDLKLFKPAYFQINDSVGQISPH